MKESQLICPFCQKEYTFDKKKSYYAHLNWHKCLEHCERKIDPTLTEKVEYVFICESCKNEYKIKLTKSEFKRYVKRYPHFHCSNYCANKRHLSDETKRKISETLKQRLLNHLPNLIKERTCKVCNKKYFLTKQYKLQSGGTFTFCSSECFEYYKKHRSEFVSDETKKKWSETGKRLAQYFKDIKRSKNEIAFCSLCEQNFSKVLHNEPIFNGWDADVILPELKVAVLWNGRWHYEKLTQAHSVEMVQNRDKIKIHEIEVAGYIPYIIKDMGKFSMKKVKMEFEKFCEFLQEKGLHE